jgi:predicted translin family RNA/ssDNA-binding protein
MSAEMIGKEYTEECKRRADEITERLKQLSQFMRDHGDITRAMDLDEALGYVEAAVEYHQ